MDEAFARPAEPPYFAVIFTNRLNRDIEGYDEMAQAMSRLALEHPGCLGAESARDAADFGITVSYWTDEHAIAGWKADSRHLVAQKWGIEKWYAHFELRIARVERAYSGPQGRSEPV